jgi:hypothetical protein
MHPRVHADARLFVVSGMCPVTQELHNCAERAELTAYVCVLLLLLLLAAVQHRQPRAAGRCVCV